METCGSILQDWRKKRRYTQLNLALDAGVSSKHLSFIETGRSIPSRKMILNLNQILSLPRFELNRVLNLAGYAPKFTELSNTHKDLKPIFNIIDRIVDNQMPYPAFVLDRHWNVVRSNDAMNNLLFDLGMTKHKNLIDALVDEDLDRSGIVNFEEVIGQLLSRVKNEASITCDAKLIGLEKKLKDTLSFDGVLDEKSMVLSTIFNIKGKRLNLFSTIAEMGAVQDVFIGEFKIELMFPLDPQTESYFKD
ncbi:MAG: helix-turn-helix domain-containing protein [Ectothiorhodospiraceae bacterium]|nr:helix-turn-helix domain-containing protein [Ectothiorhodospiraceae bacterium]